MKKLLITLLAVTSMNHVFAHDKIESGNYLCKDTNENIEYLSVDFGKDERGEFVVLGEKSEMFYLDGKPTAMNSRGRFLEVISFLSFDQKNILIEMGIYGSGEIYGEIELSSLGYGKLKISENFDGEEKILDCALTID